MLKSFRNLIAGDVKAIEAALETEPKLVKEPVRPSPAGKAMRLILGEQTLHLYPEATMTAGADSDSKDWILLDPARFFSGISGFVRIESGQSVLVGRGNEDLNRVFDFPKCVARRHLVVINQGGRIVLKPQEGERETYVCSVPESDETGRLAERRVKNLKRVREIFGGPIELLEPDEALTALDLLYDALCNEAYRPKDSQNGPGGLLDLPAEPTPIVVGDIHAQLDNLLKILSLEGYLDAMERGEAYLLFLGDTVHREGDGELDEMDSSLLTLDLLAKLKTHFPKNVFWLRGNHEGFEGEVGKGGVPQGRLLWQHSRNLRGKKYAKRLAECFELLPYLARSTDFVACHGGPPRRKTSLGELIDIRSHPRLAQELIWNRMRRTGRPGGYAKRDVKMLREAIGAKKGTAFIVSHTPLSRTGTIWTDVGEVPGHHIMFSANPTKLAIFIRSGGEMIPLEYSGEPLLDFANALDVD
jgi:hypothetical protein